MNETKESDNDQVDEVKMPSRLDALEAFKALRNALEDRQDAFNLLSAHVTEQPDSDEFMLGYFQGFDAAFEIVLHQVNRAVWDADR